MNLNLPTFLKKCTVLIDAVFLLQKTNFEDQITVFNLTSGIYKFQLTVTDTIGQSDSTNVTVLVLTPEQSEREYEDCNVPSLVPDITALMKGGYVHVSHIHCTVC